MPLFNTLINYRYSLEETVDSHNEGLEEAGISLLGAQERTNYPLSLSVDDFGEAFGLTVQIVDEIRVKAETILDYMDSVIQGLIKTLETKENIAVAELEILSKEEHNKLDLWNDTKVDYPSDNCIHELFEEQVKENPDATAVVFEEQTLSYKAVSYTHLTLPTKA